VGQASSETTVAATSALVTCRHDGDDATLIARPDLFIGLSSLIHVYRSRVFGGHQLRRFDDLMPTATQLL